MKPCVRRDSDVKSKHRARRAPRRPAERLEDASTAKTGAKSRKTPAPYEEPPRRQRGAGRLSERRRSRLLEILEREESKPRVCAHDPSKTYVLLDGKLYEECRSTRDSGSQRKVAKLADESKMGGRADRDRGVIEGHVAEEKAEKDEEEKEEEEGQCVGRIGDEADGDHLESSGHSRPASLLAGTTFFNGSKVVIADPEAPSQDLEASAPIAVEMWILPVLDQDADRHLRTARGDLGFRNALLAVSEERPTWRYVLRKGLVVNRQDARAPGMLDRRPSLRAGSLGGDRLNCTPTLMIDGVSGQLRAHLAIRTWSEERSPDGLVDFCAETASESFVSHTRLRHGRWSHVALVVTSSHALLYVDGRVDASFSARGAQRIAFNRHPVFVGSAPTLAAGGAIAGSDGLVGFLHGVRLHEDVRDPAVFANPSVRDEIPAYPRPENEWGPIISSAPTPSNANQASLARERQRLQRTWLDQQMREKESRRAREQEDRARVAREIAAQAQAWDQEQKARRAQNQRLVDNVAEEMRLQVIEAQERKRVEALHERQSDRALAGALKDTTRLETARRQKVNDEYAQELKREAKARQQARLRQREADLEVEKQRIEEEVERFRLEQARQQKEERQRQERLRRDLADQILDKECARRYSSVANDKFMTAEERALNARVLEMLSALPPATSY